VAAIERFEDIKAWQMGRELTRRIYDVCKQDRFQRDYALCDQIKRASGSVMHNIAEGFDSGSNAEFARFLLHAKRSCTEVQSELYVAHDQAYIDQVTFDRLYDLAGETRATIQGFIKYLKQSGRK
jgi:four helix bundle protein